MKVSKAAWALYLFGLLSGITGAALGAALGRSMALGQFWLALVPAWVAGWLAGLAMATLEDLRRKAPRVAREKVDEEEAKWRELCGERKVFR